MKPLTIHSNLSSKNKTQRGGADACLSKPVDPSILLFKFKITTKRKLVNLDAFITFDQHAWRLNELRCKTEKQMADARNISFRISLQWSIYIINVYPVDKTNYIMRGSFIVRIAFVSYSLSSVIAIWYLYWKSDLLSYYCFHT